MHTTHTHKYMNNFKSLVLNIRSCLESNSSLAKLDVRPASLMALFSKYTSNELDWAKYAFYDPQVKYTRNGVSSFGSLANLLVLVWTPGMGSAIHDHSNAHCIVKVLKGQIQETVYKKPVNTNLEVDKVALYKKNEVTYINDNVGLHRMHNIGTEPAVTLHLYTPPYAAMHGCHTYNLNGTYQSVPMGALYSNNGVKEPNAADTC